MHTPQLSLYPYTFCFHVYSRNQEDCMQPTGKLVRIAEGGAKASFELGQTSINLGRASENSIVLAEPKISRQHAQLNWVDDGWEVVDLSSSNGTFVNGERIERRRVVPGDAIQIGDCMLRYELGAVDSTKEDEAISIDNEAALERTLADATVAIKLSQVDLPRLAVRMPGRTTWELALDGDEFTIGRTSSNDIIVDLPQVSRLHARLVRRGDRFVLKDNNSSNGTWLGSTRIDEVSLQGGDTFQIGTAQLILKHSASPKDLTFVEGFSPKPGGKRWPVVVVPGIMGSELWLGQEKVWPNVRQLFTNPDLLKLTDDSRLTPGGLSREVVVVPNFIKLELYGRLSNYLQESLGYEHGKDLLEFAYDWRRDLRASARRLAEAIDNWNVEPPITIIAHSMGSLVSRYYIEQLGGRHKIGRLIVIGGPHAGAPTMLTQLATKVAFLPFGLLGDRLRDVVASFDSAYCLLPTDTVVADQYGKLFGILDDETWLPERRVPKLRNAREFHRELGTRSSVPTISIFGYGLDTLTQVHVRRDHDGRWTQIRTVKESGDDTVPENSAILEGGEIHPVQQHHGALYVDNDVKMRLKLELMK
jgi:pSer/pThr/pTyr-binding forkhead associated (FHA) protein/predicted alpha/beta hydrolase family esterase